MFGLDMMDEFMPSIGPKVHRLEDAQPAATPAQPEALAVDQGKRASRLEIMVSQDGIELSTRRLRVRLGDVHWVPLGPFAQ
jgi:hypothetical protein